MRIYTRLNNIRNCDDQAALKNNNTMFVLENKKTILRKNNVLFFCSIYIDSFV